MRKNILITGKPRSGKTTLLRKVVQRFDQKTGFVTNEVRRDGERIGFEIETSAGQKSMLADVNFKTQSKVSRYGVSIENLENALTHVEEFDPGDLLYLDEIGQMELLSERFRNLVAKYLDSINTCICTISQVYSDALIESVKKRDDIILIEITEENRDEMEGFIVSLLRKIGKARRYCSEPKRFTVRNDGASIMSDHGQRVLKRRDDRWVCDCVFFQENRICSHILAFEEYIRKSPDAIQ